MEGHCDPFHELDQEKKKRGRRREEKKKKAAGGWMAPYCFCRELQFGLCDHLYASGHTSTDIQHKGKKKRNLLKSGATKIRRRKSLYQCVFLTIPLSCNQFRISGREDFFETHTTCRVCVLQKEN